MGPLFITVSYDAKQLGAEQRGDGEQLSPGPDYSQILASAASLWISPTDIEAIHRVFYRSSNAFVSKLLYTQSPTKSGSLTCIVVFPT